MGGQGGLYAAKGLQGEGRTGGLRVLYFCVLRENDCQNGRACCIICGAGGETAVEVFAPEYYRHFYCVADRCAHTCCAGWQIDIDRESLDRYMRLEGPLGDRLRRSVALAPQPHFILTEDERCPFLTAGGLCELIIRLGEGALCQICAEHPRYRNYWSDRIELGLGLVCGEAGRLILSWPRPMRLIRVGEDGEESARPPSPEETALRELRDRLIAGITDTGPAARLQEYLIYRHLADALYDGRVRERLRLIERAYAMITDGWDARSVPALVERARQFSDRVEYDDEALAAMLDAAAQEC